MATATGDEDSTANIDSQATVNTTPDTIRPRRDPNSPAITLPTGVSIPGG